MVEFLIGLLCCKLEHPSTLIHALPERGILMVLCTDDYNVRYTMADGSGSFKTHIQANFAFNDSPAVIRWVEDPGNFAYLNKNFDVVISHGIKSSLTSPFQTNENLPLHTEGIGLNNNSCLVVSVRAGLTVQASNGKIRRIKLGKWLSGPYLNPQPSPDGKLIAFSIANIKREVGQDKFCTGYVVSIDGKSLKRLGPGNLLRWAHSGHQLVGIDGAADGGNRLVVYSWPHMRSRILAKGKGYCYYGVVFSPQDERVAVFGTIDDKNQTPLSLYTIELKTGRRQLLYMPSGFDKIDYISPLPGIDW